MAYTGTEGEMISRNEARALLDNYENSPAYPANNHTKGLLFGKIHLDAILSQNGCRGIRIYYGKVGPLATDAPQLAIVGTDANGNDLPNLILDTGIPCPSHCSTTKL